MKFNELTADKQKQIMNEYKDSFNWSLWAADIAEVMKNELKYYQFPGIELVDVNFSLAHYQGDGVSFTGTITGGKKIEQVLLLAYGGEIPTKIRRIIPFIYEIQLIRTSWRYCHELTVETIVIDNYNDCLHGRFLALCRDIESAVDKYRVDVCRKLAALGYADINFRMSKDGIENYYDGIEFDKSGNAVA